MTAPAPAAVVRSDARGLDALRSALIGADAVISLLPDLAENPRPALARTPVNITGTEHVPLVIRRLPRHARK